MEPLKLPYRILGAKVGSPYLVTLAGFPDDEFSGFKSILLEFSSTHRIVAMCLPGFSYRLGSGPDSLPRWGYGLGALREAMHETFAAVCEEEEAFNQGYTLVVHDWGSALGLLYATKYPERIKEIISFDVGIMDTISLRNKIVIMFYQLWFCASYFVAMTISRWVGQAMLMFFAIILMPLVGPCPHDSLQRPIQEVDVRYCYMYWNFHFGRGGVLRGGLSDTLKARFPSVPIFFMYGSKKNAQFHGPKFIKKIEETPGCRVKSYDDVGHWLQESKHKDEIMKDMRDFMRN